MVNKSQVCVAFYTKLMNMVKYLEKQFPLERDIRMAKESILFMEGNKKQLMDAFITAVGPFHQQIFARDESYFLGANFKLTSYYEQLSMKIKQLWLTMTPMQKEQIWQTFQGLLMLGTQFYS